MSAATYDGDLTGVLIKDGTDPWVELDGKPVDWGRTDCPRQLCPCGEMGAVVIPGVLDGMNTGQGVERCDACSTYPGGLGAALALARHVGGVARFHPEEGPGMSSCRDCGAEL